MQKNKPLDEQLVEVQLLVEQRIKEAKNRRIYEKARIVSKRKLDSFLDIFRYNHKYPDSIDFLATHEITIKEYLRNGFGMGANFGKELSINSYGEEVFRANDNGNIIRYHPANGKPDSWESLLDEAYDKAWRIIQEEEIKRKSQEIEALKQKFSLKI